VGWPGSDFTFNCELKRTICHYHLSSLSSHFHVPCSDEWHDTLTLAGVAHIFSWTVDVDCSRPGLELYYFLHIQSKWDSRYKDKCDVKWVHSINFTAVRARRRAKCNVCVHMSNDNDNAIQCWRKGLKYKWERVGWVYACWNVGSMPCLPRSQDLLERAMQYGILYFHYRLPRSSFLCNLLTIGTTSVLCPCIPRGCGWLRSPTPTQ
jgi:hypothetical protein